MEPDGSLLCSQEPATDSYPEQMNPVHNLPPYFSKIYSNIFLSSTLKSSNLSLPFKNFVSISHVTY
jgi:hypothetical protein